MVSPCFNPFHIDCYLDRTRVWICKVYFELFPLSKPPLNKRLSRLLCKNVSYKAFPSTFHSPLFLIGKFSPIHFDQRLYKNGTGEKGAKEPSYLTALLQGYPWRVRVKVSHFQVSLYCTRPNASEGQ